MTDMGHLLVEKLGSGLKEASLTIDFSVEKMMKVASILLSSRLSVSKCLPRYFNLDRQCHP